MPDDTPLTITLAPADWQVVLAGMHKLTIEVGVPTLNRLMAALADAQKPPTAEPLKEAAE